MVQEFVVNIPGKITVSPSVLFIHLVVWDWQTYRVTIEVCFRFRHETKHIEWLCECHEWLRPYFPFWDFWR